MKAKTFFKCMMLAGIIPFSSIMVANNNTPEEEKVIALTNVTPQSNWERHWKSNRVQILKNIQDIYNHSKHDFSFDTADSAIKNTLIPIFQRISCHHLIKKTCRNHLPYRIIQ